MVLEPPPGDFAGIGLIESISVLSLSEPSSLRFPEGLENEFDSTEMMALVELLIAGVNVAE